MTIRVPAPAPQEAACADCGRHEAEVHLVARYFLTGPVNVFVWLCEDARDCNLVQRVRRSGTIYLVPPFQPDTYRS